MKEAELKSAVEGYLQYGMNQGKWYFDRLNSGEIVALFGESRRRIKLCREGTADYFVLKWWYPQGAPNKGETIITFLELKSEKGRQRPEQMEFQKLVEGQGADYYIIKSIEGLQRILE